ncbi:NAD+ diphosphatase [Ruminiclostridium sufflavum DSM 19573]|uniref:NAD(+) diphosphatase n=1 Tax=Ruminiclostridium sufflavum DSM 19573 TaxID=1121337 RepID=A0A318XNB3_9FIRM|nr:NAD(+) diphosphatase [Ruminiclostridium sufflavum]PYG88206.1 NAD+ diphosphatase [Ruminiclostridium sufflavum DSM 19573]
MGKESIYKQYEPAVTPQSKAFGKVYWFAFCANDMLVKVENGSYSIPYMNDLREMNISPVRAQYLGLLKGCPCYSAEIASQDNIPLGMEFIPLRALFDLIDMDLFLLAGKAFQIILWDQSHQFCGRCGTPTQELPGERAKSCPKCGLITYPQICPAVITAVFRGDKILLAHAKAFKGNLHSLISGFLEPGETLEECVQREIMEEVGIRVKNIKYFGSQPWPYPNSLMAGFTAEYESGEITVDGTEIEKAGWFSPGNLPELPSQVSISRQIIDWYIQKGL